MLMLYEKPIFKSYSSAEILEKLGLLQNQYHPDPTDQTVTFYTAPGDNIVNLDGTVGTGWAGTNITFAGNEGGGTGYWRGFVGFDLSSIAGKTIVSATLRVYQASIQNEPYSNIGSLVVDHVDFGTSLPLAGHVADGTLTSNIGTISTNANLEWKTLDVKNYVQADLNASRTSSQYRVRFTTDSYPTQTNTMQLEDAENSRGTGHTPELVVTYR
jgi:hypothetical protein